MHGHTSSMWPRAAFIALLGLGGALAPRTAHAQFSQRLSLTTEHTLGTLASSYQPGGTASASESGGLTYRGTLGLGFHFTDAVALHLQAGVLNLPSGVDRFNPPVTVTAGLLLEPSVGSVGRFMLSADVGYAAMGGGSAPTFDGGAGFLFNVTRGFSIGPSIRYTHILNPELGAQTTEANLSDDVRVISGGVFAQLRFPADVIVPPGDTDGDGVIDPQDVCVTVPMGAHPDDARLGCPMGDADGDGVLDASDLCVNIPRGDEPNPERLGCPDDDNDGDGITDHNDLCRLQSMDPSPDPDRLGCKLAVRIDNEIHLDAILFETNSAVIVNDAHNNATLGVAFAALREHPELTLVEIEGHTDERDSDRHNLALSNARAASVLSAMVSRGIDASRLVSAGYGEYCPIDPGHDEAAWERNRRVSFVIAQRNGSPAADAHIGCAAGAEHVPSQLASQAPAALPSAPHHSGHHRHHHHHNEEASR